MRTGARRGRRTTVFLPVAAWWVAVLACRGAVAAEPVEPVLERCLVSLVEEAKVPAREPGAIVELAVREGDALRKGDVIARIDDNQPQMERRKAKAEHDQAVAKAESDVDVRYAVKAEGVSERAYTKAKQAYEAQKAVTEVEVDRLRLEWQKTALQIEQAELERKMSALAAAAKSAEVDATENAIERRLIKSPLDGVVVQVFPHLGEWMQPGDPLARVVRADRLRVEGYVDAARFEPDQVTDRPVTVEVVLANDRRERFPGRIVFVSPLVESGGDYRVFAEVENRRSEAAQQWLLRPGQTATMTIHSGRPSLPPVRR